MVVLDASIAAAWIFDDEEDPRADEALIRVESGHAVVPQIWKFEIHNSLLFAMRRGRIDPYEIGPRLRVLAELPIDTDHSPDFDIAFALAREYGMTFYDAVYLELAVRREAPIATLDQELARAAASEGLQVID